MLFSILDITDLREFEIQKKEIEELRSNKKLVQEELNIRERELNTSNLSILRKNNFLNSILKELKSIQSNLKENSNSDIRKIISKIRHHILSDDTWENTKVHLVEVDKGFFQSLKNKYNTLTENELRHCAYVKMGLSTKETAELLFVNSKSVEVARYRIKKKLSLSKEEKLSIFLDSF